ncbi:nucleoside deaminase [Luteimonas gilva]|uniref:nucleoside deaminase n=1 Tax=Luteimonas gilva TaxID=2572684 RepID=UPI001CB96442|nr:nucleoside deaminase [Luteimonas gilva]
MPDAHEDFMREAVAIARANIADGGRPFGAVIVRDGRVVARAANRIHDSHDPTAHAELLAIREASRILCSPRLDGCTIYASGHPCPMCLAAMHLCGVTAAHYALFQRRRRALRPVHGGRVRANGAAARGAVDRRGASAAARRGRLVRGMGRPVRLTSRL